jgi:hypothetical protein
MNPLALQNHSAAASKQTLIPLDFRTLSDKPKVLIVLTLLAALSLRLSSKQAHLMSGRPMSDKGHLVAIYAR